MDASSPVCALNLAAPLNFYEKTAVHAQEHNVGNTNELIRETMRMGAKLRDIGSE